MQILVIDRDALTAQLLQGRLESLGHELVIEPNKNAAFEKLAAGNFDCIMIDPSPLSDARPVIIGAWKNMRGAFKPYILLLSKSVTRADAILAGTNDVLAKPFDPQDLEVKIKNAARLMALHRHLGESDDAIRSGGGMIGKSAFNQLFLSAIDRAFRYGERSLVIMAHITNGAELDADAAAHDTLEKLGERMSFMRRQSDVIGRVGRECFGILLQRPLYESEPIDAINRFAEALDKFYHATLAEGRVPPHVKLELIELPEGALMATRHAPLHDGVITKDATSPPSP